MFLVVVTAALDHNCVDLIQNPLVKSVVEWYGQIRQSFRDHAWAQTLLSKIAALKLDAPQWHDAVGEFDPIAFQLDKEVASTILKGLPALPKSSTPTATWLKLLKAVAKPADKKDTDPVQQLQDETLENLAGSAKKSLSWPMNQGMRWPSSLPRLLWTMREPVRRRVPMESMLVRPLFVLLPAAKTVCQAVQPLPNSMSSRQPTRTGTRTRVRASFHLHDHLLLWWMASQHHRLMPLLHPHTKVDAVPKWARDMGLA